MNAAEDRNVQEKAASTQRGLVWKWTPRLANFVLWILLCGMAGTGWLLAFGLPPGSRGGHGLTALGMSRHEWGDVHWWISLAFVVLIVVHLALHWRWLWQIASRRRAWPLLAGIAVGLAFALGIALLPIAKEENPRDHAMDDPVAESADGHPKRLQYREGRDE